MDQATDEAIARALGAEYYGVGDPDYAGDAPYVDDSEDSDYGGGSRRKKRRAGPGGRGRGRGRPPGSASAPRPDPAALAGGDPVGPSDGEGDSDDDDDRTKTGRRRRKDVGKQRQAGRAWTAEEESLFLQAMEIHGRDWKRGSEMVGTRDHRAIASHAQKFFIKLCLAGKPLPAAVARTGPGYTLSGAMLDPYSAAARSYGFKPDLLTRLCAEELQQALSGLDLDRLPVMYGGRLPDDQAPAPPPPRNASMGGMADERGGKRGGRGMGRKRRKGPAGGGSSDGDDDGGLSGVGGGVDMGADPNSQAAAAAAMAAAMAAAAAAGGGGMQGFTQAQLMAAAAAAAALPQLAAAAGGHLGLVAPSQPSAPAFGSFTALLSGASDGGPAAPPPPLGGHAGSLAAALHAGASLGPLSAALAPALQPALQPQPLLPPASQQPAPQAPLMALPPPSSLPHAQTEYARNRPRRENAGQRAQMGGTSESLQLVKPQEFGAGKTQPYSVDISSWALLAMDFHAHLSTFEVIGLLGGTWNPDTRQLVVIEAYACRRAEGSDGATSVELDPAAQVEVQQEMEKKGQKCVGWYHSHPVFEPSPSQKDMDNQRNYQALTRCEQTRLEPFLGFIVGPYDIAMPQPISVITTFTVQTFKGNMIPYSVRCQVHGYEVVPDAGLLAKLVGMLDTFREDPGRVDFAEMWRGYSYVMADGCSVDHQPLTRLAKFRLSLGSYMREADPGAVREVVDLLCTELQSRWGVNLAAAMAAANAGAAAAAGAPAALTAPPQAPREGGESMLGLLLADGDGLAAAEPPPQLPHAAVMQPSHAVDAAGALAPLGPPLHGVAVEEAPGLVPMVGAQVAPGGMMQALLEDDDPPSQHAPGPSGLPSDAVAAQLPEALPGLGPGSGLLAQMTEAVQGGMATPGGFQVQMQQEQAGIPVKQEPMHAAATGMYGQALGLYDQAYGQATGEMYGQPGAGGMVKEEQQDEGAAGG